MEIRAQIKKDITEEDLLEIYCKNRESISAIINVVTYKTITDDLTVAQVLNLTNS